MHYGVHDETGYSLRVSVSALREALRIEGALSKAVRKVQKSILEPPTEAKRMNGKVHWLLTQARASEGEARDKWYEIAAQHMVKESEGKR